MVNAQQSFMRLWKRLVAALSLVAAAALTPVVPVPANGAAGAGSRVGNGAAFANAANALIANMDVLVEGGQRKLPAGGPDDAAAKTCSLSATPVLAAQRPGVATAFCRTSAPRTSHAARSGLTRAPPSA